MILREQDMGPTVEGGGSGLHLNQESTHGETLHSVPLQYTGSASVTQVHNSNQNTSFHKESPRQT